MGRVERLYPPPSLSSFEVNTGELIKEGYTKIPFDRTKAFAASELFKDFLKSKSPHELSMWCFAVDDPSDPDDGLIRKESKSGGDIKYYFHWSPLLLTLLEKRGVVLTPLDQAFLQTCKELFELCEWATLYIGAKLDYNERLPIRFLDELKKAKARPLPFSRAKLRLLEYDALELVTRAGLHQDKSLITAHVGDRGGNIFICENETGRGKRIITPAPDEALVFFGLKAERLTKGEIKAIWHGAEADPLSSRSAAAYFAHANLELQHSRAA